MFVWSTSGHYRSHFVVRCHGIGLVFKTCPRQTKTKACFKHPFERDFSWRMDPTAANTFWFVWFIQLTKKKLICFGSSKTIKEIVWSRFFEWCHPFQTKGNEDDHIDAFECPSKNVPKWNEHKMRRRMWRSETMRSHMMMIDLV